MSPVVSWSFEPAVLVGVAALAIAYGWAWRRARLPGSPHPPGYGRLALFFGGLLVVLATLVSPLDSLGDQLMVMHMVQHMLLLDIAPILMILGLTKGLLRPVTRRVHALERRAGPFAHPAFAVITYGGLLWLWHLPALYDSAQGSALVHVLEHLCFAAAGTLYWWHVLSPIRSRMRLGGMGPIAYMVSAKLFVGLLGVVLAFAPSSIYSFYTHKPSYWGLSPHFDQSMAGVVMALEQSIVMGIALVYLFVRMLGESEREAQRAERFELV
ncbi:MAG TPA: cytochrome c oxidase assembly protein [Solirubrobacteraceae bacterium]|nr:cytochrome c oxidase assembly protein [Solirubrobacteraceae bacterium]